MVKQDYQEASFGHFFDLIVLRTSIKR